ncbi:MAG: hypothetical protein WCO60_03760 [Verrucomicrobiota bacterium]
MTPTDFRGQGLKRTRRHLEFRGKLLKALLLVFAITGTCLTIGVLGYRFFAGFTWVDSFLNASMILGGMGPVGELPNDLAKVFASLYALFSGLVMITATGLILSPMFHKVLHSFHIDESDD